MAKQDDKDPKEDRIKSPILSIPDNNNNINNNNNNNNNENNENNEVLNEDDNIQQISRENPESDIKNHQFYFPIPLDLLIPNISSDPLVKRIQEKKPSDKSGSYVYAKNITYTVKHRDDKNININLLEDISFYIIPKEMTLILGSPGCGKSTIFKVLSGLAKNNKHMTGTLLFNGHPINPINHHRDISYVPQDDLHMPTLTVKETLKFALDCQAPEGTTKERKIELVNEIINLLGLNKSANTVVGNNFIRGISGGQLKRVTIGVSIIKGSSIVLMDEPTTGLDSVYAFDIMVSLKKYCMYSNAPALVALLQPSVQLTSLFDKLLIMSRGQIAFFGPLNDALAYFEELGYQCPIQGNPAEFFQEVIDNSERYSIVKPPPLKNSKDFVKAYKNSKYYKKLMEDMENNPDGIINSDIDKANLVDSTKMELGVYPTKTTYQMKINLWRGGKMLLRNYYNALTRVAKGIFFGLLLGGLFFQLGFDQVSLQDKFGLLFFIMVTIIFSSFAAVNAFFQERAIFYSQRNQKYYKTIAYFIASVSTDAPIGAAEVVVFGSIVYWMVGFRSSFIRFVYFLLLLFFTDNMSLAFAKMVASLSPTVEIANVVSSVALSMFLLFSGFTAAKPSIGGWWIYMYYLSPYTWIFYGLAENELADQEYFCKPDQFLPPLSDPLLNLPYPQGFGGHQTCQYTNGNQILAATGMTNGNGFKWVCLAIVISYALFFYLCAFLGLQFLNFGKKQTSLMIKPPLPKRLYYKYVKKQNISGQIINYEDIEDDQTIAESQVKTNNNNTTENEQTTNVIDNEPTIEHQEIEIENENQNQNNLTKSSENPLLSQRGCYLQFKDLSYAVDFKGKDPDTKVKVKKRLELLKKVNGFARPGKMLALMGPSGAGKSTLLDVLANRKTGGHIDGEILINGKPRDKYFNRIISYVEQFDVLPPTQTVKEAISFSATCRLTKDVSEEQRINYIDKIIDVLGLKRIENLKIGIPGNGLSLSQRKRVNIGVELAANPQLLFLDEPTSGLASDEAYLVVDIISRVAKALNRTIICTIHQPSSAIFSKFDSLLLLKNGENIYFGQLGQDNEKILGYLSTFGMKIKPHINPADFILDMAGDNKMIDGPNGEKIPFDPITEYKKSKFEAECKETLEKGILPDDYVPVQYDKIFASSWTTQFTALCKRSTLAHIRRPLILFSSCFRSLFLAVVLGTLFIRMDFEQIDARNRVSFLFFSFLFAGMVAIGNIPTTVLERGVFYREITSGFYHSTAYSLSYILTSYPFTLLTAVLYIVPAFFLAGLDPGPSSAKFWYCFFVFIITYIMYDAMGVALSVCLPNEVVASTVCGVILSLTTLFAGFLITKNNMGKGWLWLHYLDMVRYPLEASATNEFFGETFHCTNNVGAIPVDIGNGITKFFCPITDGIAYLETYGFHIWMRYIDIAPILAYFAIYAALTIYGFKKVRWVVR